MINHFDEELADGEDGEDGEELTIGEGTYVVNVEDLAINDADLARLNRQDAALSAEVPLFPDLWLPKGSVPQHGVSVLDVACGPAGWLRAAYHYFIKKGVSDFHLVGIDNNKKSIHYAKNHEKTRSKEQVDFQLMDMFQPWQFPDASFDFVNARLLTGVVPKERWVDLLEECRRVLKPGGVIRFTESELSWMVNAPACNAMVEAMMQVLWSYGRAFTQNAIAISPMLPIFLERAGFSEIDLQMFTLDWSYEKPLHDIVFEDMKAAIQIFKSMFLKNGMTEEKYKELYQQMIEEAKGPNFFARWPIITCVGRNV